MPAASYSPRLRTAVVLCGAGTAGAYQAGVIRALTEAGVKTDLFAAHGAGVMTALCAAVDGGARLWDAAGPWTTPRLHRAYRWRTALRIGGYGLVGYCSKVQGGSSSSLRDGIVAERLAIKKSVGTGLRPVPTL